MKRTLILGVLSFTAAAAPGFAEVVNFDFSTPLTLSNTPGVGVWSPDRYAPNGFVSQATAPDSTPNTLQETISPADYQATSFFDTQGRGTQLPVGSPNPLVTADVSVYTPGTWATEDARVAGFWAQVENPAETYGGNADYGIIEYQGAITTGDYANGGVAGFYGWNNVTGTWAPIAFSFNSNFSYNSWVNLSISLVPTGIEYTVGNASIITPYSNTDDSQLSQAILQGYDGSAGTPEIGSAYSIYWNGLQANDSPVPEPGTVAMMLGGLGTLFMLHRRRARLRF